MILDLNRPRVFTLSSLMNTNPAIACLRLCLLVFCAMVWGLPSDAAAEAGEQGVQITRADAYRQLRRGDELRERREWAEAVGSYHEALEKYRALARNAPAWEEDYYRFRIGYCERELAMIVRTTGRSVDNWLAAPEGAVETDTENYRARYLALQEENRYLRNQLEELRRELEIHQEMEDIEQDREDRRSTTPVPAPVAISGEPPVLEPAKPAVRPEPAPARMPRSPLPDRRRGPDQPVPLR